MTKKEVIKIYKDKLANNKSWQLRALLVLTSMQTNEEYLGRHTNQLNGVGFNQLDADILIGIHRYHSTGHNLTDKQFGLLSKKLPKYASQLVKFSSESKIKKLFLEEKRKVIFS